MVEPHLALARRNTTAGGADGLWAGSGDLEGQLMVIGVERKPWGSNTIEWRAEMKTPKRCAAAIISTR